MATKYAAQIARAQARIQAKGQLVAYTPVLLKVTPYVADQPWKAGYNADGVSILLSNLINTELPEDVGSNPQPSVDYTDPNATPATVELYAVFLDAKARGSSTQGMSRELIGKSDVVGGNKLVYIAGGQGVIPAIGDTMDRNVGGVSGYALCSVSKIKSMDVDGFPILYTLEIES